MDVKDKNLIKAINFQPFQLVSNPLLSDIQKDHTTSWRPQTGFSLPTIESEMNKNSNKEELANKIITPRPKIPKIFTNKLFDKLERSLESRKSKQIAKNVVLRPKIPSILKQRQTDTCQCPVSDGALMDVKWGGICSSEPETDCEVFFEDKLNSLVIAGHATAGSLPNLNSVLKSVQIEQSPPIEDWLSVRGRDSPSADQGGTRTSFSQGVTISLSICCVFLSAVLAVRTLDKNCTRAL